MPETNQRCQVDGTAVCLARNLPGAKQVRTGGTDQDGRRKSKSKKVGIRSIVREGYLSGRDPLGGARSDNPAQLYDHTWNASRGVWLDIGFDIRLRTQRVRRVGTLHVYACCTSGAVVEV